MANYTLVFGIALLINVVVTLRSSEYWERRCAAAAAAAAAAKKKKKKKKTSRDGTDEDDDDDDGGGDMENALLPNRASSSDDVNTEDKPTASSTKEERDKTKHASLLRRYLAVYLLAVLSDWLQGPYVYALYDAYGYSQHDIAVLFVTGFGSSMVFGSFVGGMADQCGRRKFVLLFSVMYGASCLTKHMPDFRILMLGRLLGGISTSLLFSVFDAWLIRAHSDSGIDRRYLSKSFSSASYGNSVVAVGAGLLADRAAGANSIRPFFQSGRGDVDEDGSSSPNYDSSVYLGGYLNPFDIALLALVLCGFLAAALWEENYGDSSSGNDNGNGNGGEGGSHKDGGNTNINTNSSSSSNNNDQGRRRWYDALRNASIATWRNADVLLCGLISSLFEGSMYIFVFMWTPALTSLSSSSSSSPPPPPGDEETITHDEAAATAATEGENDKSLPFGLIFSTFMVCCMAGSSLFSILSDTPMRIEVMAVGVLFVSSLSMVIIVASSSDTVTLCGMSAFETCVGMYWPIMGTMKGVIVPEDKRAAIYNLFRIPLNLIVLTSLLINLTPTAAFVANAVMLGCATALQVKLAKRRSNMATAVIAAKKMSVEDEEVDEEMKKSLLALSKKKEVEMGGGGGGEDTNMP